MISDTGSLLGTQLTELEQSAYKIQKVGTLLHAAQESRQVPKSTYRLIACERWV